MIQKNTNRIKYISLVTLTLQNAILGLSMRYACTRSGDMFLSSTAVVMSEVAKFFLCLVLVFNEEGREIQKCTTAVYRTMIKNPVDTLKIFLLSVIYIIENNLLYLSAFHLDAATNQVTKQLKILTTAMFAIIILRRKLLSTQWGALLFLIGGVVLVQLSQRNSEHVGSTKGPDKNQLIGFVAAVVASFLSGFSGIYFEKILKDTDVSLWMRNVQLSFMSLPIGLITCFINDNDKIKNHGFLYGYDAFVWYLILLQAGGGLIVGVAIKYADNILTGFATSFAIVISSIASIYIFVFTLTWQFAFGSLLVIFSIFLYSYEPTKDTKTIVQIEETTKQYE